MGADPGPHLTLSGVLRAPVPPTTHTLPLSSQARSRENPQGLWYSAKLFNCGSSLARDHKINLVARAAICINEMSRKHQMAFHILM